MDLQNLGDDEILLGSLVGRQPEILNEAIEALDVGGWHLANRSIQCGLCDDDEEESNLMIFGWQ